MKPLTWIRAVVLWLLEFLDEGGFRYPFPPFLPNVTRHPFLIPGPPDSSNSDAVVLHQFPGPLEVPQESEATTGSYHVAPTQVVKGPND
ncbi:uncharacterized protein FIBRA_09480 [Fibroporia radiculosa]|uniref:Secreted protein n=1 Tax=Fibroporia radiculosa TaxID=599839 RepID=J7SD24_9APHY|nr:uncharacterized protein FIBRA_09480 [Fibroporia radiculosa]CCM07143.1 predicted protein [Fibroporia radiculosa]